MKLRQLVISYFRVFMSLKNKVIGRKDLYIKKCRSVVTYIDNLGNYEEKFNSQNTFLTDDYDTFDNFIGLK
jgi:hypothetical protein